MAEKTYSLIFLFLFVVLLMIDSWKLAKASPDKGSELHAVDRYAVADRIMYLSR